MKALAIVAIVLLFCVKAGTQSNMADSHHKPGGRDGEFRFFLAEDIQQTRADFATARRSLERLRTAIANTAFDPALRRELQVEADRLDRAITDMHERFDNPAGTTAALVEDRLNTAKGKARCANCHSAVRPDMQGTSN